MREMEVKSAVDDLDERMARVRAAGGVLVMQGLLEDSRYDTIERGLSQRDEMLRVRSFRGLPANAVTLDWKGPTSEEFGYKTREEISTGVTDPDTLTAILGHLGYVCTLSIHREITQFSISGATVRFEQYPRMDHLVEVEGAPEAIERAIEIIGLPRHGFTSERLGLFISRFEARTGVKALLSNSGLIR